MVLFSLTVWPYDNFLPLVFVYSAFWIWPNLLACLEIDKIVYFWELLKFGYFVYNCSGNTGQYFSCMTRNGYLSRAEKDSKLKLHFSYQPHKY